MTAFDGQDTRGVLKCIWQSGTWKIFPLLLLYSIGFATLFPIVPTLVTNGFASQAAGHYIDCQDYTPATSPTECRNAHAQAVFWNSWTSFVSGSILSFVCAPVVGKLSDDWGRKPFMLAGVSLGLAPMVVLMFFVWGWVPIQLYYPFSAANGMVSSFSLSVTMVADLLHQCHRATVIGYLSACFSIGILIGPILGGYISTYSAVYVCIGMCASTLLYIAAVLPETAPRVLAARRARQHGAPPASRPPPAIATAADDPLLAHPLLSPQRSAELLTDDSDIHTGCTDNVATLGQMDFDPIPNVVPHPHVHTVGVTADTTATPCANGASHTGHDHVTSDPAQHKPHSLHSQSPHTNGVAGAEAGARKGRQASGEQQAACGGVEQGERGRPSLADTWKDMMVGWRIIKGSSYYRKLVVIMVIVAMTWEGAQDMLMQYLQLTLGFKTHDQANLLILVAAVGLLIKLVFLASLVRLLGEQWLLFVGLSAYLVQDLLLAVAPTKAFALASIGVGSLACVSWPASMALQTRHADPKHVGAIQGALSSVSSLASGIGPVGFAWLFSAFSRSDSSLPYFPQVVWLVAAGMTVMGLALVATLHWSGHDPSSHGYSPVEKQDDLAPADYAKDSTAGTRKRQPSLPAGSDHV